MHLEHIAKHLEKRNKEQGLVYALGSPASETAITDTEQRLAVKFPQRVVDFYHKYNGLNIEQPHIEILPIESIGYCYGDSFHLLHFGTVDRLHKICLDISHINEAGQWDIVSTEGYCITLSMASFWSNKLWAWVDKRRTIWKAEFEI